MQFEQERIEDSKKSLEQLLDSLITRQKETMQAWEASQQPMLKMIPGTDLKRDTTTSTGVAYPSCYLLESTPKTL